MVVCFLTHDHNSNKSSSFVADKWVCISNYIVWPQGSVPSFFNLPCLLLFIKYDSVHWHFLKHFIFCCLTCSLSGNACYMFPSDYCLNMCSAVDNYVHVQTVYTRFFFSLPTKSLGTRLGTVVKGQLLKYWIHNPGRVDTELKVCFYEYTQSDV